MRLMAALLALSSVVAAQQRTTASSCGIQNSVAWQNYEAYDYQRSVLRLLRPNDRSLVSLSVFVTGNTPEYFVRMNAPGAFEILRASSDERLDHLVIRLGTACQLPTSPQEALKLMDIKWERKSISSAEFQRIYGSFSKALSQYASNVKNRPLKDGARITIHSPEFSILYSSAGFEKFELTALESQDEAGNLDDPIARWAKGFISDLEREFKGNSE